MPGQMMVTWGAQVGEQLLVGYLFGFVGVLQRGVLVNQAVQPDGGDRAYVVAAEQRVLA